jgi:hypothetical protein
MVTLPLDVSSVPARVSAMPLHWTIPALAPGVTTMPPKALATRRHSPMSGALALAPRSTPAARVGRDERSSEGHRGVEPLGEHPDAGVACNEASGPLEGGGR